MIEPWDNAWSRFIYRSFHHEPFLPSSDWNILEKKGGGPLSSANGALPAILFKRDRIKFEARFPELQIIEIRPLMPISYILSGGFSFTFSPSKFFYSFIRMLEKGFDRKFGMFALVVLQKKSKS
jgi:hypothetical protein